VDRTRRIFRSRCPSLLLLGGEGGQSRCPLSLVICSQVATRPGDVTTLAGWRAGGHLPPHGPEEALRMSKSYQAPLNWYTGGVADTDVNETEEWLTAFEQVVEIEGRERARFLLKKLLEKGHEKDVILPFTGNTPYINTIPKSKQPSYGGDRALERRI